VVDLIESKTNDWCDKINTTQVEDCDFVFSRSLSKALREIERLHGSSDMTDWAWGDIHQTFYGHTAFADVRFLHMFFNRKIANGGSTDSVNVSAPQYSMGKGYYQIFGAGFRQVIHFDKQQTEHYYMNSTGQSGNVMSPNYDDMVEPFRDMQFYQLNDSMTPKAQFKLIPANGSSKRKGV